jgi:hypothetical protein
MARKNTGLIIIIGLIGILVFITGCDIGGPGKYDEFAVCVSESGAKLYSAWWCPHCKDQKDLFGKKSFKILDGTGTHVECSPGGTRTFSQFCKDQGVTGTPMWKLADDSILSGKQPLEIIAQKTGCEDALIASQI